MFLGAISSLLTAQILLAPTLLSLQLSILVWLVVSLLGVAVSLTSLFLHSVAPDRKSLLDHRGVGYLAVALTSWPWLLNVWLLWFVSVGPP